MIRISPQFGRIDDCTVLAVSEIKEIAGMHAVSCTRNTIDLHFLKM